MQGEPSDAGVELQHHAQHTLCPELPPGDLWVFGYGSLMWNPDFEHTRAVPALLRGYHRAFCIHSVRHRGTPEQPGLVLGLDRGGACRGIAFLVAEGNIRSVLAQLWAREMSHLVYRPRLVPIVLEARKVPALAFIADRANEGYAGRLELNDVAAKIASCSGARGPNIDYLANSLQHLDELGIREPRLHAIWRAVERRHAPRPAKKDAETPPS